MLSLEDFILMLRLVNTLEEHKQYNGHDAEILYKKYLEETKRSVSLSLRQWRLIARQMESDFSDNAFADGEEAHDYDLIMNEIGEFLHR